MDRHWIVAAVFAGIALVALAWARGSMFPKRREFQHAGEVYVRVPEKGKVTLFGRWYKSGSFEYSDGTLERQCGALHTPLMVRRVISAILVDEANRPKADHPVRRALAARQV